MRTTRMRRSLHRRRSRARRRWKSRRRRAKWRHLRPPSRERLLHGLRGWILSSPTESTASFRHRQSICASPATKLPSWARPRSSCTRCCGRRPRTRTSRRRAYSRPITPMFYRARGRDLMRRREWRACCPRASVRGMGRTGEGRRRRTRKTRRMSWVKSSSFDADCYGTVWHAAVFSMRLRFGELPMQSKFNFAGSALKHQLLLTYNSVAGYYFK
mmetsp:Transcript_21121/g.50981  ORF Transcript_21121/g.50981 Transcript_21121/m.50981 type:complete len:215 (+) Transcript_21121:278-922(+)